MNTGVREAFLRYFHPTWDARLGWESVRFVVLDTELTGLDPRRDRLVSIGAVSVVDLEVVLEDAFEVILPIAYNTSAVTLHGITREEAEARGVEEPVALERFVHYLRDGVIVGHHIDHDVQMLAGAAGRHFGLDCLPNLTLDTMDLTLRLEESGWLPRVEGPPDFTLDGLCRRFGIRPHDRHTAIGDAFITAQVLLVLLRRAKRAGYLQLGRLTRRWIPPEARR